VRLREEARDARVEGAVCDATEDNAGSGGEFELATSVCMVSRARAWLAIMAMCFEGLCIGGL